MTKPTAPKNRLGAIHASFKALGLTKEDACALKMSVTGKGSCADMTEQQRKRLLARLAELQADAATQRGETPAYVPKRPALHRSVDDNMDERWHKARALWAALADAGHVHTATDDALMAFVKSRTGVEHWRFLNTFQITRVIEMLKKWCDRKDVPTRPAAETEPAGADA